MTNDSHSNLSRIHMGCQVVWASCNKLMTILKWTPSFLPALMALLLFSGRQKPILHSIHMNDTVGWVIYHGV